MGLQKAEVVCQSPLRTGPIDRFGRARESALALEEKNGDG